MQRVISTLMLFVFISLLPASPVQAWFFGDNTLVTIDETDYTTEEFKRWWGFWKEEGDTLPETPDFYIDWLLLAREGRRMELDSDPGFKRGTNVFLLSRTLLKLKYEEIDSQINVTDADVKKEYEERYVPRYFLEGMEFKDEAIAKAAWQELTDGSVTVAELLDRDLESGGPVKSAEMTLRKGALESKWADTYQAMVIGDVLDPKSLGESKVLWYLKGKKGADDEDFTMLQEKISKDLRKTQGAVLTRALIADLREKYEVKIDEERLDAIDLKTDGSTLSDEPVITSTQQNVSEKDFYAIMQRLFKTRPMVAGALADEQATKQLKGDTAYNVIAQSVTNWEALDRHYEEKEPFKWAYDFNYDHRLVLSVQQRLFSEQAKVTDDEVRQEYDQNKSRYTVPSRVKLYIIDETQGPIDTIWAETATGLSIDKALTKHMENYPGLKDVPANHLDPEIKPVVDQLTVGETSPIFSAQGIRVMVHLSERIPEAVVPFDRIKENIQRDLLSKKIEQLQENFSETIKSGSEIDVQPRQWEAVQKELGGA
jgi:hypothetical protein